MWTSAPFRLHRSALLLALISTAFAGEAGAAAARVDFTSGSVTVSGADGRERPLARGSELDSGDTVRTAEGRAQLRFTDGAYVSLQPNTEFSIKDYHFEGKTDGSERGLFALARGAMRAVTGLVGRVNRSRYRITTPTATVGIRGTGGIIQVLNDGSTLIVGTSGIWSLTNPVGSIDVPAGVSGLAPAAPDAPPRQTTTQPQTAPASIRQEVAFTQGEQRTASGDPLVSTFKPLVSGSGYAVAIGSDITALGASANATAGFDGAGQMTDVAFGTSARKLEPGGSHAEFHTDGILAWGRWIGPVASNGAIGNYGPDQGLHYVIGLPTPSLPTTGTATYVASTAAGTATSATYVSGGSGVGSFTGRLEVNFGAGSTILGNFDVAMPGRSYSWSASGTASGSAFSMSASSTGVTGCVSSCTASVQGFFAGASAERVGAGYSIVDPGFSKIVGAAAFQKQ